SSPISSGTPSRCTTAASTSRCSSPRRWSDTSSASSRRPARSRVTSKTTARRSGDERLREEQSASDERLREEQSASDERLREEQREPVMITTTEYPSAVAKARFVRISPTKARRVIDLVRGKSVTEALHILRWAPQAASQP